MVRASEKIPIHVRPFLIKIEGFNLPVNLDKDVFRESREGMVREFFREQYRFNKSTDGTEEREYYRQRLKKLRKIMKDMNKVLRIQL